MTHVSGATFVGGTVIVGEIGGKDSTPGVNVGMALLIAGTIGGQRGAAAGRGTWWPSPRRASVVPKVGFRSHVDASMGPYEPAEPDDLEPSSGRSHEDPSPARCRVRRGPPAAAGGDGGRRGRHGDGPVHAGRVCRPEHGCRVHGEHARGERRWVTGALDLGFTVDFFGTDYSSFYVNNNGNITFDEASSQYPVWTWPRSAGRSSPRSSTTSTPAGPGLAWSPSARPPSTAIAHCVNWVDVGYYSQGVDRLNSGQLVLVDRSDIGPGDFDMVFNYGSIAYDDRGSSSATPTALTTPTPSRDPARARSSTERPTPWWTGPS